MTITLSNETKIPTFLQASIVDTLKVQLSTDVKITCSIVLEGAKPDTESTMDVVSIMGIESSGLRGSFAIAFPKGTFLSVVEALTGEKHAEISNENADACSELLNIIYAAARVKINESGFDFKPAIPSTICGHGIWLPVSQFEKFMRFDCESNKGPFMLALALKRTN